MTKLRLQLEDLEERLFQQQQQQQQQQDLVEEPPHLQQPIQDETNWQRLQREHELRIAELQQKHTKVLATLQTRHQEELGHLRESQASDVERLRELEMDYDRRMASLQGLSPGKTLEQVRRQNVITDKNAFTLIIYFNPKTYKNYFVNIFVRGASQKPFNLKVQCAYGTFLRFLTKCLVTRHC